jgi:hypothetical protein
LNEPDIPDVVPHVPGTLRGRKWNPPSKPKPVYDDDIEISLDLGEDVEVALSSASTDEIVDLAGTRTVRYFYVDPDLHEITSLFFSGSDHLHFVGS